VRRAASLGQLTGGRTVARDRLRAASRWSDLAGVSRRPRAGMVELGELCRVHRGQVTGNNRVWIAGPDTPPLPPRLLVAAVTRARELFEAGPELAGAAGLRRVIALPAGLDDLDDDEQGQVERFLRWARERGADRAYVARHRAPWWAVRFAEPAPILATYMARRPPAFVRNRCAARHINIAHGIYPREPLTRAALDRLADCLRTGAAAATGRTYAGGLMKFEPREMERILIPRPA
jgi:adenine-specific DNA-methyltransferase